jgi:2-keto-4-pentenoate hydratase/2-oxohepta-3-ene-1,7-dioic acid hydratase in catechol pathway
MHGSTESYAITDGIRLSMREQITEQLNIDLPKTIEEFLFGGWIEIVKSNHITLTDPIDSFRFLHPIRNPSKIICLGYNYLDHAREQGRTPPEDPVIFIKPRTTLIGSGDTIMCPRFVKQLDYEGELAFVIARRCKDVPLGESMRHVLGYMVFNDVSARDIQFGDKQWTRGKSFDTFAPCGPWITTGDEIADPHDLQIVTKVNGEVRQDSSTRNMALNIGKILSSLSRVMTLEEGDLIATGTPSGVAVFMKQPKFLQDKDIVEIEIEKLGRIKNQVKFID